MATKAQYGTVGASAFFGILAGLLIRKSKETRDIDAEARKRGYIKPSDCPSPCGPLDQITDQGKCQRCGGTWVPATGPYGKGECVPMSGGSGSGGPTVPGSGLQPPLVQPPTGGGGGVVTPPLPGGPGTGAGTGAGGSHGGPSTTLTFGSPGNGLSSGTATKVSLPPIS